MFATTKYKWLNFAAAVLLGVSVWLAITPVAYSQELINTSPGNLEKLVGVPLTSLEREHITNRLLTNQTRGNENSEVVRLVRSGFSSKNTTAVRSVAEPARPRATAVVFDYGTGNSKRVVVDSATGDVISEEELPGRPQPSQAEIQRGIGIAQDNSEVASLLRTGAVVEGGFAVNCPSGAPPSNRCLQLHFLTTNRRSFQKVATVNLNTRSIAKLTNRP